MAREPVTSGSLKLPKDIGISETQATAIEGRWNTLPAVDENLRKQGIHKNSEPDIECPVVTTAILVTADIKEYSTVFSAQLRWYNYVTRLLADVRANLLQVVNEMKDIEATKRAELRKLYVGKEKMSIQEMEDAVAQDAHYRELSIQKQGYEQHKLKLEAWCETLDRNHKTVSRQIENRKTESQAGNREGNMSDDAARPGRWQPRRPGG